MVDGWMDEVKGGWMDEMKDGWMDEMKGGWMEGYSESPQGSRRRRREFQG